MHALDNALARAEQRLNPVDYIPFISMLSGKLRLVAGLVEIIAAVNFALLQTIRFILFRQRDFCRMMETSALLVLHGFGNMVRGFIAILPGINLLLISYDKDIVRMNYPEEEVRRGVYPIMTAYRSALCL